MTFDWQTAAVLVVVGTACVYLARAARQTFVRRKAAACGACASCPAAEPETFALGRAAESPLPADEPRGG